MTPLSPAESAVFLILMVGSLLLLFVLLAAPIEAAARRSPGFADWLDRLVEWVFRG